MWAAEGARGSMRRGLWEEIRRARHPEERDSMRTQTAHLVIHDQSCALGGRPVRPLLGVVRDAKPF